VEVRCSKRWCRHKGRGGKVSSYLLQEKEYESVDGVSLERIVYTIEGEGCGIINHDGHANYSVVPPFGSAFDDGRPVVDGLENKDKYFIFYTIGCLPAKFEEEDSIGEHFVKNPEGSAVSFVGNSRYGWYSSDDAKKYSGEYDIEFFRQLFSEKRNNIGKTLAFSKIRFIPQSNADDPYRWIQYCLNLLGDPDQ
jgi:hypothetical protein